MVKALVRSAAAVLLLLPLVHRYLGGPVVSKREVEPVGPPTTLADILSRGEVRLAAVAGSATYYFDRGVPAGFEYELLGGFAAEVGISLRPIAATSREEAARLVGSGEADLAVLPRAEVPEGAVRAVRYLRHGRREEEIRHGLPVTGALFVRRDSPELVAALNGYLVRAGRDGTVKLLYERYFAAGGSAGEARDDAGLSEFDPLIARHARAEGVDWRLVAAVISAESRFDPDAVSSRGARGLMQLMPSAATETATADLSDPETNVRAGVRYLRRLIDMFPDGRGAPNLPIVLAAYLVGPGHVLDARQLAGELGYDPETWEGGLEEVMPLLENPAYYEKTRLGYAQGRLAVEYVERVLERYELYKVHFADARERRTRPLNASTRRWAVDRARLRM